MHCGPLPSLWSWRRCLARPRSNRIRDLRERRTNGCRRQDIISGLGILGAWRYYLSIGLEINISLHKPNSDVVWN